MLFKFNLFYDLDSDDQKSIFLSILQKNRIRQIKKKKKEKKNTDTKFRTKVFLTQCFDLLVYF